MYWVSYHHNHSQCRDFYNSMLFRRSCHVDGRLLQPHEWLFFLNIRSAYNTCISCAYDYMFRQQIFLYGWMSMLWLCDNGWQVLAHTSPSTHTVHLVCASVDWEHSVWSTLDLPVVLHFHGSKLAPAGGVPLSSQNPWKKVLPFFWSMSLALCREPWTTPEANLGCRWRERTLHCSMPARLHGWAVPGVINLGCLLD